MFPISGKVIFFNIVPVLLVKTLHFHTIPRLTLYNIRCDVSPSLLLFSFCFSLTASTYSFSLKRVIVAPDHTQWHTHTHTHTHTVRLLWMRDRSVAETVMLVKFSIHQTQVTRKWRVNSWVVSTWNFPYRLPLH